MKIRTMLRGIFLLLLMVSGLSVFLNCKGPIANPAPYTVTFDAQGGSAVAPIKTAPGKTIAKPADPVKELFTFGGWYKERTCTTPWNFATDIVTANITLYAKWNAVTVAVMFAVSDGIGGTLTAKAGDTELSSGARVKKDTEITFTAKPNDGYEVEVWNVNGETKHDTEITVKADKDITATVKFKAANTDTYTVTFDAQGGSAVAPIKTGHGKTIAKPADPIKASFTFGGWYKEKEYKTLWDFAADTVTADITLYAKWTPVVPAVPANVTVTFAVSDGTGGTLKAKADGKELTSGEKVKKDTEITFTAKPNDNYEVEVWNVNGEKKSGTTITTEKIKADKNITVTVKFKAQGAPATEFFTVNYSATPAAGGAISAKDANGKPIHSEDKIEKETALLFTAIPNAGYDIFDWTGATAAQDKKTAKLTVTGDISVTVTFTVKQYTVTFDAQGGAPVPDSKQVEHGKTVEKPADPVNGALTFGGWYKEKEYKTLWDFAADTVTANITLYAKWSSTSTTIQFDSTKMTCLKDGKAVNAGATVYENDELFFTATPTTGQTVNKWRVNNVEKEEQTNPTFYYQVKVADAQSGAILIDYTETSAVHAAISFDSSKITCRKGGETITSGTIVQEHDELYFIATLPEGQTVDKWTVNGVEQDNYATQLYSYYTVRAEDVQSGIITIGCRDKTAARATIQFDSSKMRCWKPGGFPVNTNTYVYENDNLNFAPTPPDGQTVNKWIINGKERTSQPSFGYTLRAEDTASGTLTVDYTLRTAAKATIHFDSSKMVCRKNVEQYSLSGGTQVDDGGFVYENDRLIFFAKPSAGKMADAWTINGSLANGQGNTGWYDVTTQPSELRFEYTEKTPETLELRFDPSKIRCTKVFDNTEVSPGS